MVMGDGVVVQPDLAAWLLEQVAEDERRARGAQATTAHRDEPGGYGTWRVSEGGEGIYGEHVRLMSGAFDYLDDELGEHVVTWAPARVLAECDTKRKIVDLHTPEGRYVDCPTCTERDYRMHDGPLQWCETLRLLAAVYKHRDGYRQEWEVDR